MSNDTPNAAVERDDCWRASCDGDAEEKIVGEQNGFETYACEACASTLVEKGNWRYADG